MQATPILSRTAPVLRACVLCLLMCCGLRPQSVEASTLTYNFGYRAEYSDNVFRIQNENLRKSDVIGTLTGGFSYVESTSTFNARVAGSAAYLDYYRNNFDSELNFALDAYTEFFFVPQVMSWVVADGFRQVQIDSLQPNIPTNRQNSNVFLTGPNIYLHLGLVDTVTFEARYGRAGIDGVVGVGRVDTDNDRNFFAARWAHRLSTWSTLTFNHEYLGVKYEDSVNNSDYQRQNFFLRTNIRSARNDYTFDLGKTRIDLERGNPISNWLVRLAANRQMNSLSSVNVLYGREYSDTGAQLLPAEASSQPSPGGIVQPVGTDIVASELFYTEQTVLSYIWRGNTFPWTARAFSRNVDYEITGENREEKGSLIDISYLYSNSLSFLASSSYVVTTYSNPIREDRDAITGVGLLYRLARSLTAGLDLRRYARTSSAQGQEYIDNRIGATITYSYRPVVH